MLKRLLFMRSKKQARPDPFTLLGLYSEQKPLPQAKAKSKKVSEKPSVAKAPSIMDNGDKLTRQSAGHLRLLAAGMIVCAVALVVGLFTINGNIFGGGAQEFAYFEIKAIDPSGHPVAGALVRHGENRIGITDSFGEWRRFMRVQLGRSMAITISKKTPQGKLQATRNFAVPYKMPASGEIEVTGRIQLQSEGTPVNENANTQVVQQLDVEPSKIAKPIATPSRKTVHIIYDSTNERNWSAEDRERGRMLRRNVVPSLAALAVEKGYQIDPHSHWQLVLTHLPIEGDTGFVMLTSRRTETSEPRASTFIRNYMGQASLTAERLFAIVDSQPENGWQDKPPVSGWQAQELRVLGTATDSTHVFVSGFPAYPKDGNTWTYWGQDGQRANLTVVQQGQIIYRSQIVNSKASVPFITIPKLQIASP